MAERCPTANPNAFGYTKKNISLWRWDVFERLGPDCVVCGRGADHLHEGIVWRSEAMGFPFPERLNAFAECNSFPICAECHTEPPPRAWFFERSCARYGEDEVREWYASFEWKVPPVIGFMPEG